MSWRDLFSPSSWASAAGRRLRPDAIWARGYSGGEPLDALGLNYLLGNIIDGLDAIDKRGLDDRSANIMPGFLIWTGGVWADADTGPIQNAANGDDARTSQWLQTPLNVDHSSGFANAYPLSSNAAASSAQVYAASMGRHTLVMPNGTFDALVLPDPALVFGGFSIFTGGQTRKNHRYFGSAHRALPAGTISGVNVTFGPGDTATYETTPPYTDHQVTLLIFDGKGHYCMFTTTLGTSSTIDATVALARAVGAQGERFNIDLLTLDADRGWSNDLTMQGEAHIMLYVQTKGSATPGIMVTIEDIEVLYE